MAFGRGKTTMGSTAPEEHGPYEGPQWEYATVAAQITGDNLPERLNQHGARGWEAVGITTFGAGGGFMSQVLMKRQVRSDASV
jgi:hypothetical protein